MNTINETILFLTYSLDYSWDQDNRNWPVLRHIINDYCPAYLPFDLYIGEPLKKIFSKVIIYDFLKRRCEIGLQSMNEEIIALAEKERPKYVLWTSFNDDVQQPTLEKLRAAGSIIVGWFFDDDWRFNNYSKYWAHYLNYIVTNCPGAVPKYKEMGAQVIQTVPNTGIAIDPDWPNLKEKFTVTFVGSAKFANRGQYLETLRRQEVPIETFGAGSGGYVSFERMLEIFKTSKINLNFSMGGVYYWDRQIKGRIFQVCMAGGFMLTEKTPGIEKYYDIDKEIVCFEDAKEMIDKIRYYLSHESERRAIARAGWEKSSREHTSFAMVAKVFEEIGKARVTGFGEVVPSSMKLAMPLWVRRFPSEYHLDWAIACLQDNCRQDLLKEAMELSLRYDRFNVWAWYFAFAKTFPTTARMGFFKLYRAQMNLRLKILRRLQSISLLRKVAEPVFRKLW